MALGRARLPPVLFRAGSGVERPGLELETKANGRPGAEQNRSGEQIIAAKMPDSPMLQ